MSRGAVRSKLHTKEKCVLVLSNLILHIQSDFGLLFFFSTERKRVA